MIRIPRIPLLYSLLLLTDVVIRKEAFAKSAKRPRRLFVTNQHHDQDHDQEYDHHHDHNTEESRLVTVMDGGNGSFGNMFDVRALSDVEITRLEFHTDLEKELKYSVYSKEGSYVDFEAHPEKWTSILFEQTAVGQGMGNPTSTDPFPEPLAVAAGETRSFYVSLLTADIRYTLGTSANKNNDGNSSDDSEGWVFASDRHVELLEGVGVAGYPFGPYFYRPRVFNGAVSYRLTLEGGEEQLDDVEHSSPSTEDEVSSSSYLSDTSFPTSPPAVATSFLTAPPTFPPKESTSVMYRFLIHHSSDVSVETVPRNVDSTLYMKLMELFYDPAKILNGIYLEHGVEFLDVVSTIGNGDDCPSVAFSLCSIVTSEVLVHHFNTISEEEVRYALFLYVDDDITPDLSNTRDFISVRYVGYRSVKTEYVMTLHAPGIREANQRYAMHAQDLVRSFLESRLVSARVAAVELTGQTVRRKDTFSGKNDWGDGFAEATFHNRRQPFDAPLHDERRHGHGNDHKIVAPLTRLQFMDDVLRSAQDDDFSLDDEEDGDDGFSLDDDDLSLNAGGGDFTLGEEGEMRLQGRLGSAPGTPSDYLDGVGAGQSSSLDLSLTITGEYLPPPNIDFTEVVGESFSDGAEDLLFLVRRVAVFENVTKVTAAPRSKHGSSGSSPVPTTTENLTNTEKSASDKKNHDDDDSDKDNPHSPEKERPTVDVVHEENEGGRSEGSFFGSTLSYIVFGTTGFLLLLLVTITVVGMHHNRKKRRLRVSNAKASTTDNQNYIYDIAEEDESMLSDTRTDDNTVSSMREDFANHRRFSDAWGKS